MKKAAKRVKTRAPGKTAVAQTTTKPARIKAKSKSSRKTGKKDSGIIPAAPEAAPAESQKCDIPEVVRPVGRPTLYTRELAEKICLNLAEGQSLRSICKAEEMPEWRTVLRWRVSNPEFCQQYEEARELQAETFYDELLEIADDGTNDFVTRCRKDGSEYTTPDMELVARSKMRVDARKWAMAKILRGRYGEKVEHKHSGKVTLEALVLGEDAKATD